MKSLWEKELSLPQKHCALYAKGHYKRNDIQDDLRLIYSMNKNGVLANDNRVFENLVHPTLVKIIGPERFAEYAGTFLSDIYHFSELRPDDPIEAYLSRIGGARTAGEDRPDWLPENRKWPMLEDVSAKRIDHDRLEPLEPR